MDMNFIFSCSTRYLVEHEKIKFLSTRYILHICLEVNVVHIFTSELIPCQCGNITLISDDSILLYLSIFPLQTSLNVS